MDSVIEVSMKATADQVVALDSALAAPRGPNAVWLPCPPKAAEMSPLLPLCSSTTTMMKKQTRIWSAVISPISMSTMSLMRQKLRGKALEVLALAESRPAKDCMVRKGGFEPPRLSAPPPQDGVSASSTTSAGCKLHALNNLAIPASQLRLHRILHRPFAFYTPLWRLQVREPHKQLLNGLLSRRCT